ncbi:MAG TPA: hypothetical protein DIW64_19960 [Cellvibrio sp.]|nr:hypothetical protein [Cellvibrio sp.]
MVVVCVLLLSKSGYRLIKKTKMNPDVKKPPLSTEMKNAGAKQEKLTKIARVGIVNLTRFANTQRDLTSLWGSSAENTHQQQFQQGSTTGTNRN